MKLKHILLLVLLAAIWGSSYLFLRLATPAMGISLTMASRIILGAIVMIAVFSYTRKLPDYRLFWKQYIVLGVLNILLPFGFITYSITNLNASIGAILNATTPLFTIIVSSIWQKEQLNYKKIIGIVVGLLGLTILVGWMPLDLTPGVILSIVLSLSASLSYAVGAVYTRKYLKHTEPLKTATGMMSAAAVLVMPLLASSPAAAFPGVEIAAAVFVLGVFCTALGYSIYFKLLNKVGATNVSVVTMLVPVFSLLWGLLFLHEPITPAIIVGLLFILGSLKIILIPKHK